MSAPSSRSTRSPALLRMAPSSRSTTTATGEPRGVALARHELRDLGPRGTRARDLGSREPGRSTNTVGLRIPSIGWRTSSGSRRARCAPRPRAAGSTSATRSTPAIGGPRRQGRRPARRDRVRASVDDSGPRSLRVRGGSRAARAPAARRRAQHPRAVGAAHSATREDLELGERTGPARHRPLADVDLIQRAEDVDRGQQRRVGRHSRRCVDQARQPVLSPPRSVFRCAGPRTFGRASAGAEQLSRQAPDRPNPAGRPRPGTAKRARACRRLRQRTPLGHSGVSI